MLTHEQIWTCIDRLARENGYSASGLAKQAGLDPTTFNKSKRTSADGKPRWPSTESISKILAVTGADMAAFLRPDSAPDEQPALKPGDQIAIKRRDGSVIDGTLRRMDGDIFIVKTGETETVIARTDTLWTARILN